MAIDALDCRGQNLQEMAPSGWPREGLLEESCIQRELGRPKWPLRDKSNHEVGCCLSYEGEFAGLAGTRPDSD